MIEAEKRIREALEKAPTHGEWVAYRTGGRPEVSHAIPPFIAACNPTNIAALLADRDEREAKMLAEIDRLRAAVQHEADCVEAAKAEIDRLTRARDALAKQAGPFRRLVDACKLLSSEAEEYEFDDGMGRGAMLDYWHEFDRKLDAALAQIEQEKANGSR